MAKPKNKATRTYTCQGRLNRGTKAHETLQGRRLEAAVFHDAVLNELASNHPEEALSGNQAQLTATKVAQELGVHRGNLQNRCRIAIAQKAVNVWNHHLNHNHGIPRTYEGKPVRTIETFAHSKKLEKPLVTLNEAEKPTLHFPGLPPIRLYSCRKLPQDQPTYASVSVDGRKISVNLTYRIDQAPLPPEGLWDPFNVLGLDRGIAEIIADSAGIGYEGIAQKELQEKIKKAAQFKQAMVRKAIHNGLAGFKALLDENNKQILTQKGTPRRYLHWTKGKPTKEYSRAAKCLSRLLKQRTKQRVAYRHQVAAQVVKHCVQNGIQLIALEKLNIKNMTKSARGTQANPGRNVAQKRGLNRRILAQGWGQLASFIRYKARRHGIRVVEVYAPGTSQTCSTCGHRDRNSKKSSKDKKSRNKKHFQCVNCGFTADADYNAALNIGDRGTHSYVRRSGAALEEVRKQRLSRANGPNPERQQPGTGLDDATADCPPTYPMGSTGFRPGQIPPSSRIAATRENAKLSSQI